MDISPLTTFLGAEIAGVDLRHLNAGLIQEIENVLHQYSAVFFRDQPELSPAELTDPASAFGPVFHHPSARAVGLQNSGNNPRGSDFPGIIKIEAGPDTKKPQEGKWHSDTTCDKEPPILSILQVHEVPPVGGDTVFSSMYAAYEALSPHSTTCRREKAKRCSSSCLIIPKRLISSADFAGHLTRSRSGTITVSCIKRRLITGHRFARGVSPEFVVQFQRCGGW